MYCQRHIADLKCVVPKIWREQVWIDLTESEKSVWWKEAKKHRLDATEGFGFGISLTKCSEYIFFGKDTADNKDNE